MIVEDEPDLSYLYRSHLARLGIDSITFDNPLVALNHYQQNRGRYALILLDWTLPIMNGLELAKRIRKINSNVRILLISGHPPKSVENDDGFSEAKISQVLQKPILLNDLGRRILKLCE
jgi:DNA-binding response OmpR family regulator